MKKESYKSYFFVLQGQIDVAKLWFNNQVLDKALQEHRREMNDLVIHAYGRNLGHDRSKKRATKQKLA